MWNEFLASFLAQRRWQIHNIFLLKILKKIDYMKHVSVEKRITLHMTC